MRQLSWTSGLALLVQPPERIAGDEAASTLSLELGKVVGYLLWGSDRDPDHASFRVATLAVIKSVSSCPSVLVETCVDAPPPPQPARPNASAANREVL